MQIVGMRQNRVDDRFAIAPLAKNLGTFERMIRKAYRSFVNRPRKRWYPLVQTKPLPRFEKAFADNREEDGPR